MQVRHVDVTEHREEEGRMEKHRVRTGSKQVEQRASDQRHKQDT